MSRILIVDDEPGIVEILSEHLALEGYDVAAASSGEAALELMQRSQPDLVILDVMLPGMDGYEVCTRMQVNPDLSQVPVIMLTARTLTDDLVSGYERGADDYITKPCDLDELLIRIRAQLHHLYREQVSDLTGLPGSQAVEEELASRSHQPERWVGLYADIQNLRIYNEVYSFSDGDSVIRAAAHALKSAISECGCEHSFAGHLGGGSFVVIVPRGTEAYVQRRAQECFAEDAQQLFSQPDRERGYLIALDRDGRAKQWSLPELTFDLAPLGAGVASV